MFISTRIYTGKTKGLLAPGALALLLAGCVDALLVEPAPRASGISVSFALSGSGTAVGGAGAAFDKTNRLVVRLEQGGTVVTDTSMAFQPATAGSAIAIPVELPGEQASVQLSVSLLRNNDRIFVGSTTVTLQRGETTPVTLDVDPVAAGVRVSTSTSRMDVGDTTRVQGVAVFATGDTIPNAPIVWTTSTPSVLRVLGDGRVISLAEGEGRIVGTYAGQSESATVQVLSRVASVSIANPTAPVRVGETLQLSVEVRDKRNNPLVRTVSWSSSNPNVATVSTTGLVTGVSAGQTIISAQAEGVTDTAVVQVTSGQVLGNAVVNRQNSSMLIYDNGNLQDGDSVTIYLNGVELATVNLTHAGQTIPLTYNNGQNTITITALNEGTARPNTAGIQLSDVVAGTREFNYSMPEGASVDILVTYDPSARSRIPASPSLNRAPEVITVGCADSVSTAGGDCRK